MWPPYMNSNYWWYFALTSSPWLDPILIVLYHNHLCIQILTAKYLLCKISNFKEMRVFHISWPLFHIVWLVGGSCLVFQAVVVIVYARVSECNAYYIHIILRMELNMDIILPCGMIILSMTREAAVWMTLP